MNAFSPQALTLEALRAKGEPQLFERDPLVWRTRLVTWFEEASGRTLYPDQTEMFLIEMAAYALASAAEEKQAAILANLAVWAENRHLDDVGANASIFRLLAQPAATRIAFTLPVAAARNVLIPKGTRLTAGQLVFATDQDAVIATGSTNAQTNATATIAGANHNGFQPGQVTVSLGSIATGLAGANVTVTAGGADVETDDRLRESVIDGPEAYDRHGGWGGYGLAVRRVSPEVIDVAVDRPQPGHIHIVVLTKDGPASEALHQRILDALIPDVVIPHGDTVTMRFATATVVSPNYTIRKDPLVGEADLAAGIDSAVQTAFEKLRRPTNSGDRRTRFAPATGKLGAQIAPGKLTAAIVGLPGVVDASTDLAFSDLPFDHYPVLGVVGKTYLSAADV